MQRGTRLVLAASVMATSVFSGCVVERTYEPEDPLARSGDTLFGRAPVDDVDVDDPAANPAMPAGLFVGATNGMMKGDIGPAHGISQRPERLGVYDDGWYASIEAVAVMPERAAMMLVTASRPDLIFQPGVARTFLLSDPGDEDGRQLTVLGCTGASMDSFDEFDVPADEVDVIVEAPTDDDAPAGEVVVQVNARWLSIDTDVRLASTTFHLQRE